jgi:hypothetical protein
MENAQNCDSYKSMCDLWWTKLYLSKFLLANSASVVISVLEYTPFLSAITAAETISHLRPENREV